MRTLLVHPSGLMYSEIFLRLEPLGLERVAGAPREAGHQVRLLDLQVFSRDELARELHDFAPDAVGFSLNYLANVPEVIELAHAAKAARPGCFVFVGGHSVSLPVQYELPVPEHRAVGPQSRSDLYIHPKPPRRAPAQ